MLSASYQNRSWFPKKHPVARLSSTSCRNLRLVCNAAFLSAHSLSPPGNDVNCHRGGVVIGQDANVRSHQCRPQGCDQRGVVLRSSAAASPAVEGGEDVVETILESLDEEPSASVFLTNFRPQRWSRPSRPNFLQKALRALRRIPQYIAQVTAFRLQQLLLADLWVKMVAYFVMGIPAIALGAVLYCMASGATWGEGLLKAYGNLYKLPGAGGVIGEGTPVVDLILNVLWFAGTFSFAIVLGMLTEEVSQLARGVRTGNYPLPFTGHVVICGWNRLLLPIVRQINVAHFERTGAAYQGNLVVLANHDKRDMDAKLRTELGTHSDMEWYTRSGYSFDVADLAKVNAAHANTVIVLPPDDETDTAAASEQQLSTMLALNTIRTHSQPALWADTRPDQHVMVQLPDTDTEYDRAAFMAAGKVIESSQSDIQLTFVETVKGLSRLLAQSAIQPGTSTVVGSILQQTEDNAEFYIKKLELTTGVQYKDVREAFSHAVVCGYLAAAKGVLHFNPKDMDLVSPGDYVLALAQNANFHQTTGKSMMAPEYLKVLSSDRLRTYEELPSGKSLDGARDVMVLDAGGDVADVTSAVINYSTSGSRVVAVCEKDVTLARTNEDKMLKVSYSAVKGRPAKVSLLVESDIAEMDSLVIVTNEQPTKGKLVDAQLQTVLLAVRDALANSKRRKTTPLHIVAAVHSSTTSVVANDLLATLPSGSVTMECVQPVELLAGMVVQMSIGPVIGAILKAISCEGGQISLASVSRYLWDYAKLGEVTFAEVSERVRKRGDTAIGYVTAEGAMIMAPDAGHTYKFHPLDRLVVVTNTQELFVDNPPR